MVKCYIYKLNPSTQKIGLDRINNLQYHVPLCETEKIEGLITEQSLIICCKSGALGTPFFAGMKEHSRFR